MEVAHNALSGSAGEFANPVTPSNLEFNF